MTAQAPGGSGTEDPVEELGDEPTECSACLSGDLTMEHD